LVYAHSAHHLWQAHCQRIEKIQNIRARENNVRVLQLLPRQNKSATGERVMVEFLGVLFFIWLTAAFVCTTLAMVHLSMMIWQYIKEDW